jgi:hypothetical protein
MAYQRRIPACRTAYGFTGMAGPRCSSRSRLNYMDIYLRSGLCPVPLPSGIGTEAVGVVEAIGSDVTDVRPGNRVANASGPTGAYFEVRVIPAARTDPNLVAVPTGAKSVCARRPGYDRQRWLGSSNR